jgi:hypothetical protein
MFLGNRHLFRAYIFPKISPRNQISVTATQSQPFRQTEKDARKKEDCIWQSFFTMWPGFVGAYLVSPFYFD